MSHGHCGPHPFSLRPAHGVSAGFDKPALRSAGLAHRAGVTPEAAAAFAARLARLGPEIARAHGASAVSAYAAIGDEVATSPLLAALHAEGIRVGLPVTGTRGTPLVFRRWLPDVAMVPGRMNIPEPPADAGTVKPDLLFVPLAAFDRRGHRIGYGAGFYDRTLAALRRSRSVVAVGIAYAAQETLFVPAETHDEALDFVLTDRDVIVCAGAG